MTDPHDRNVVREGDQIPRGLLEASGADVTYDHNDARNRQAQHHRDAPHGAPGAREIWERGASAGVERAAPAPPQGVAKLAAYSAGQRPPRKGKWFTFPKSARDDASIGQGDESFFVVYLEPHEEQQAAAGSTSGPTITWNLARKSVHVVNRTERWWDYDRFESWWQGIGPKGRQFVLTAFADMNTLGDNEGEAALRAAEPDTV